MNAEIIYLHQRWEESHGYGADNHIKLDERESKGAEDLSRLLGRDALISCLSELYIAYDEAADGGATDIELNAKAHELEVFHRALILSPETHTAA